MRSSGKGLESVRTLRGQVSKFRIKTPAGALIELARLAQKKEGLRLELERWYGRIRKIQSELEEIDKAEMWLHQLVDDRQVPSATLLPGKSKKSSPSVPTGFHEMNIRY